MLPCVNIAQLTYAINIDFTLFDLKRKNYRLLTKCTYILYMAVHHDDLDTQNNTFEIKNLYETEKLH